MNTKQRKFAGRISVLLLLLAAATLVFSSCATSKSSASLTVGTIVTTEANSDAKLADVAKMIAATTYQSGKEVSYPARDVLIAATRGYDMTAADFDDGKVEAGTVVAGSAEETEKIAKRALTAVNEQAEDSVKVAPAEIEKLNLADVKTLMTALQETVDTTATSGVLDVVLCAIGKGLNWLTNTLCFGSYVVGICIFAIVIEVLMLPFAVKQQKNSIKQANLRPREMAIRNKYKGRNDQKTAQAMQQEIQEFYQRENFSPASGCLPLLIQLPIIMALYYIVIDPLHYVLGLSSKISTALSTYYTTAKAAGGLGQVLSAQKGGTIALLSDIKDKGVSVLAGLKDFQIYANGGEVLEKVEEVSEKIPNFSIGSLNLGLNPSFEALEDGRWLLLLIPILTFVAYFFTSKLNRKFMVQPVTGEADSRQVACSNTMMDVTMPAMSTVFTFWVPGVVGIYWIFRSLLGLLKSFIMSRVMPLPVFTDEDYKKAAREMVGKKPVVKSQRAGTVRSLHHIDDEDYDDTRDAALARKQAAEEAKPEEGKKSDLLEQAPLKDDEKDE